MTDNGESTGCRTAAISTGLLLAFAVVFVTVGFTLANREACSGLCQTAALTLLYGGGPISGLLGVVFGWVLLAWPLDVTLWVVAGFVSARWAERRSRSAVRVAIGIVGLALALGLVLSLLVEIAV